MARGGKEIVFVNTPTTEYPPEGRGESYETIPPVGLGYVATVAKEVVGASQVSLIDAERLGLSPKQIADLVLEEDPNILAMNVMSPTAEIAWKVMNEILTQRPHLKVILGGPHLILYPATTLQQLAEYRDQLLWASTGEGEIPIRNFLKNGLTEMNGIAYFEGEQLVVRPPIMLDPVDLNRLILDHDLFPDNGVNIRKEDGRREAYMLTSRGCPFKCAYCAAGEVSGRRLRLRSTSSIKQELLVLLEKLSIEYVRFIDDLFIVSEKRILEIIENVFKPLNLNRKNFGFEANVRANIMSKLSSKAWDELAQAGLTEIEMGIESGSRKVLKLMNKGITPEQVITTVKEAVSRGVKVKGFLMVGYPGETKTDLEDTLRLARTLKEIGGNKVRLSPVPVKAYPGTPLGLSYGHLVSDKYVCVDLTTLYGDDPALKGRTRYNAMHIDSKGHPVALSELTGGASTAEVLKVLAELIITSVGNKNM